MSEDTYSEEYRHRCEVRYVLEKRARLGLEEGREWFSEYFERVKKKRGQEAATRLSNDAIEQWRGGNRGDGKAWITYGGGNEGSIQDSLQRA